MRHIRYFHISGQIFDFNIMQYKYILEDWDILAEEVMEENKVFLDDT